MNRDPFWRPLAPDALAARSWDDELVVYNDATGNTHHLSVLGRGVMMMLLSHPSGIPLSTIVRAIADDAGTAADDELAEVVERTLVHLAELRLAESVLA
jgi:PqqD family protein of HPr-rel-A system